MTEPVTSTPTTQELISFRIDDQEFCLDVMSVREIRGWTLTTVLPNTPRYVRGVINLRGAVLPVLDLKDRLGLGQTDAQQRSVIIVVRSRDKLVGLLVDAVSDILTVETAMVQPTPKVGCETVSQFIRGIIAVEGRMISWIAIEDIVPGEQMDAAA
ncbi:MAG: purine-binding chemotaxis protein CheW [Alphaproteobacteria bacterium]|nr:purine-binding chemotaxis protein CheW [Alphaproteobacteria bacterium]